MAVNKIIQDFLSGILDFYRKMHWSNGLSNQKPCKNYKNRANCEKKRLNRYGNRFED
jgi:hypothetical protein